jgi:phosphoenolpyruvate phosphomutase
MRVDSVTGPFALRPVRVGVGVHNALTAMLAERAGYDVLWLGSLEVCSSLGLPDLNVVSARVMADVTRAVRAVSVLPIFVDADNGYGSDETALRALREFERAGATAMCIEDNAFPKCNSLLVGRDRALEDADVFARRIERLAEARSEIQIIARTEALVAGFGPEEADRRLTRYAEAGADALFAQANATSAAELPGVVTRAARLRPTVIAPTVLPHYLLDDWTRLGVDTVIFANVVVRNVAASVGTMLERLRRAGRVDEVAGGLMSLDDLFDLTGTADWLGQPVTTATAPCAGPRAKADPGSGPGRR